MAPNVRIKSIWKHSAPRCGGSSWLFGNLSTEHNAQQYLGGALQIRIWFLRQRGCPRHPLLPLQQTTYILALPPRFLGLPTALKLIRLSRSIPHPNKSSSESSMLSFSSTQNLNRVSDYKVHRANDKCHSVPNWNLHIWKLQEYILIVIVWLILCKHQTKVVLSYDQGLSLSNLVPQVFWDLKVYKTLNQT